MSCIFCDIINKKIPTTIVFEDDLCIVINDIAPRAPLHLLIIPKQHIPDCTAIPKDDTFLLPHLFNIATEVAEKKKASDGFRIITNVKDLGGQSVMHLHFHLIGGKQLAWPLL